jgi:hypothetical protein
MDETGARTSLSASTDRSIKKERSVEVHGMVRSTPHFLFVRFASVKESQEEAASFVP